MPFLLLILLMGVCTNDDWAGPRFGMGTVGSVLFTGMTVCALLLASGLIARLALLQLARGAETRDAIAHRYSNLRSYFFFATLGGYAFCLFVLGWGSTAHALGTIRIEESLGNKDRLILIPGGELLVLAPLLIVQIGSWFFFYDADQAFHASVSDPVRIQRFWSRRGYALFLLRQQMIFVFAPLLLLMSQQGLDRLYPQLMKTSWMPFVSLLIFPTILLLFPLLLPTLLALKPLPRGHIRDRLETNARRLRFRYSQIYLWDTHGAVGNALVVGIVPWIRYVVFTDRLLDELSDDETDAVFGHEVGHVHYGHILYYALFLMLSFVLIGALAQSLQPFDDASAIKYRTLLRIAPFAMVGVYMFAAFGFISRRCERQADIFGCRAGSCADAHCKGHDEKTVLADRGRGLCRTGIDHFIQALRRVDEINGMTKPPALWRGVGPLGKLNWIFRLLTGWLHTWQHSTILKRIAFLESVADQPAVESRFQFRLWILKWLIMLGLVAALLGLAAWKGMGMLLMTM